MFNIVCTSAICVIVVMGGLSVLSGQVTRRLVTRLVCTLSSMSHVCSENMITQFYYQYTTGCRLLSTTVCMYTSCLSWSCVWPLY